MKNLREQLHDQVFASYDERKLSVNAQVYKKVYDQIDRQVHMQVDRQVYESLRKEINK